MESYDEAPHVWARRLAESAQAGARWRSERAGRFVTWSEGEFASLDGQSNSEGQAEAGPSDGPELGCTGSNDPVANNEHIQKLHWLLHCTVT